MKLTIAWRNDNPATIWNRLAVKLGREPTHAEATAEVHRILSLALQDTAERGALPHQRKSK